MRVNQRSLLLLFSLCWLGRRLGYLKDTHGTHEINLLGQTAPYTEWPIVTHHAVVDYLVSFGFRLTGDMAADQVHIQL